MKRLTIQMLLVLALLACQPKLNYAAEAARIYPGKAWQQYASPEKAGWSSAKLEEAQEYSKEIGSAAVVVVYGGKILASWRDVERKYKVHSIRKSFLNALIGIHVKEGHIDLNKTLAELGIDDDPPLTETEKTARFIDLLKSRSGVYHRAAYQSRAAKARRPKRGSHAPGTFYYYNNWDFNTLGAIFEQETGTIIFEEFHKRIVTPLQMEHFNPGDGYYHFERDESIHPAYPFHMSALDMARFGLLYLREGRWKNKQIIPKEWIKRATTPYSSKRNGHLVGFKWNIMANGILSDLGAYYTSGRGGHRIFILPKANLVFVHRVNTSVLGNRVRRVKIENLLRIILSASPYS